MSFYSFGFKDFIARTYQITFCNDNTIWVPNVPRKDKTEGQKGKRPLAKSDLTYRGKDE